MDIQGIKTQMTPILQDQGVIKAAVFGSQAIDEAKENSDVDLLVQLEDGKSLMDLMRLQFVLEDKLGKKVDLLTYASIHPLFKDIILKEQKIIYDKN